MANTDGDENIKKNPYKKGDPFNPFKDNGAEETGEYPEKNNSNEKNVFNGNSAKRKGHKTSEPPEPETLKKNIKENSRKSQVKLNYPTVRY